MPASEPHASTQIRPMTLADYLDVMSKAAFQSGISWEVVEPNSPPPGVPH